MGAVWDEQDGDVRRIVLRMAAAGSGRFGPPRALNTGGSAFHPFIAGLREGFLIAWPGGTAAQSAIVTQRVRVIF